MAVETRIKLTNLISKFPEEAIDSLYGIIYPMFAECLIPESRAVRIAAEIPSSVMGTSVASRSTTAKAVGKLLFPQQIL